MIGEEKFKDVTPIHPEIKKFWSGDGIKFFIQELPVNPYINDPKYDPRHNLLYCRVVGGRYSVIAKTLPYPVGKRPANIKYEIFYPVSRFNYESYSEEQMLRIIKLKAFL